ncbi:MAG: formate--tetrahydrofolate ligase [Clostridia bacterium]|nr:formate--tetrahydrofolate ligase [Clostridia bacterium]
MMTDIEIARAYQAKPIQEIAAKLGLGEQDLECYGKIKAKVLRKPTKERGKLVLVTAMNPTPLGEGKTTVSIGLIDALQSMGVKVAGALREPSLGPVFGVKGGATGGGKSQVVPMEEINLHFTGDLHAITAANNLLSAMLDNHIFQGNALKIDPTKILWRRAIDMNDRSLRTIVTGQGVGNGATLSAGFDITAASEVMAILCLSKDLEDLKQRLGNILVAYNFNGEPVTAKDLEAHEAMTILLKEAMNPNLVQTLEGAPVFIHGGPFANIAHGCNSIVATQVAMSLADITVTEAGFGADLGAEKFLDVKRRVAEVNPSVVVVVATVKALKYNGGVAKADVLLPNDEALIKGYQNLKKHIENVTNVYKLPCVVALNRYSTDTEEEYLLLKELCEKDGATLVRSTAWGDGGAGAVELAKAVLKHCEQPVAEPVYAYDLNDSIEQKLNDVCVKVYGAKGVALSPKAKREAEHIAKMGKDKLPVIIAKTQYSLSDNAALLGRPEGFTVKINEIKLNQGAGFIVAIAGDMMRMPGLGKTPAATKMTIDADGVINGLS